MRQQSTRPRPDDRLRLTVGERATLDALNDELPPELWDRCRLLSEQVQRGDEESRAELLRLIQKIEEWNVRRLIFLEGAAQRRGAHFPELMKANGIRHHPDSREPE